MSDFPKDVWLSAIAALDGHGEIRIFEVIASAILAERKRCAAIASGIARDLRNGDTNRFTAAKIAGEIMATPKGGDA